MCWILYNMDIQLLFIINLRIHNYHTACTQCYSYKLNFYWCIFFPTEQNNYKENWELPGYHLSINLVAASPLCWHSFDSSSYSIVLQQQRQQLWPNSVKFGSCIPRWQRLVDLFPIATATMSGFTDISRLSLLAEFLPNSCGTVSVAVLRLGCGGDKRVPSPCCDYEIHHCVSLIRRSPQPLTLSKENISD